MGGQIWDGADQARVLGDDPDPPAVIPPDVNRAEAVGELHRPAVADGQLEQLVVGRVGQLDAIAMVHRSPPASVATSWQRLTPVRLRLRRLWIGSGLCPCRVGRSDSRSPEPI